MFRQFSLPLSILLISPVLAQTAQTAPTAPVERNFVKETGTTYGPWRSSVLGGGGYIQNVVAAPTNRNRFYTYVDVGGLYRSDDGAKTWKMLHGALPPELGSTEVRGLIVDPRDDKNILVATGSQWGKKGGIYASSDAGNSFQKVLAAQFYGNGGSRSAGFVLTRDSNNPDVVMTASATDGAFRSEDNGKTWKSAGATGLYPSDLDIDRSNSRRMWLCAGGGKVNKTEFTPGFYRSDDAGATWQKLLDAPPAEIVQDPKNANALYGIFGGNIIRRSTNGGESWEDWSQGLKIDTSKKPGSISGTGYRALTIGPDFILTGTTADAQFFKLPAGGATWEHVERNAPEVGDWFHKGSWYFGGAMGSITVDPNDANHWFITDFFAIYQTRDAGKNWRLTIDGIEVTVSHALLQDPSDAGVVHLGQADVGPATSLDGGKRLNQNKVLDQGEDKAGGKNMKAIDLSPKLPNRLYGVGDRNYGNGWAANQVYLSIDRGQTWKRSPMAGLPGGDKIRCTTIVADLNDPYTVYLTVAGGINEGGGGGVYKSTNGGASWSWMSAGMPVKQWANYFFPFDIWAHGRQLAASSDGSLVAISQQQNLVYRYDPKTKLWSNTGLRAGGGKLYSVVADRLKPGRFFIGARSDGIYRSDNGGQTWKKVYSKSGAYVATDSAVSGRVAAGTLDGVILSTDGGETWRELDKSLPYRFDNIPAFAGERLLVGSAGSGVFWTPLSPAGERDVQAKPLVVAEVPAPQKPLPTLQNADFNAETLAGWKLEKTAGEPILSRDAGHKKGGAASLLLSTNGAASGTITQQFAPTRNLFTLSGAAQAKGSFKVAQLTVQSFDAQDKPLAPAPVFTLRTGKNWWDSFKQSVALPPGTTKCRLALSFEGDGQIWLDELAVSAADALFLSD